MTTVETVLQGFAVRTDQGGLGFCGVYLLRAGSRRILVDVGHVGRRELLIERLRERGLAPADIDTVVLTHAHWDHCLNLDVFPTARVLLSRREHEYLQAPHALDWATPPWTGAVFGNRPVEHVRDGEEIATDIRILEVPGHSPGSIAVLARTAEGVVGMTGDALPNLLSARRGICYLVFWDEDEARRSVARIVESCDIVRPGHDRAFRVRGGDLAYLEPASLRFTALPEAANGTIAATLSAEPPPFRVVASARRTEAAGS
jgi:N-acyl homoserine lactone hydrolase